MVNLNVADIQGFVLRGYNFPFARYLLLELAGPETGLKLRAIDKRNLAEEIVPQAHSKLALDSVDQFDDFDRPLEHDKQSRELALIDRVLAGAEIDVRSRPRDIRQCDWRQGGKDRNRGKFVWRQHVCALRAPVFL